MEGKIAYRFETPAYPGNIVYVNLIANYACVADCNFCSRPRGKEERGKPNIYEKKAESFLYLSRSPSINEVMKSIDKEIKQDDAEVAIIGLGEPLIYLPKVEEVVKQVKEKYQVRTRIDTNGLVKCMHNEPAQRLEQAGLDEIRISLNAINEAEYNILCKPKFEDAFEKLTAFIRECVDSSIETRVSFVSGFEMKGLPTRTNQEYIDFAQSLGIKPENIILRNYVEPE